jgi:hypothetical protein
MARLGAAERGVAIAYPLLLEVVYLTADAPSVTVRFGAMAQLGAAVGQATT